MSTTSILNVYDGEVITVDKDGLTLSGLPSDPTRGSIRAPVDPSNNIPTSVIEKHGQVPELDAYEEDPKAAANMAEVYASVVESTDVNLSEPEKELLRWHFKLGHMDMKRVQFLMRGSVLAHSEQVKALHTRASRLTKLPKCAACMFAKQTLKAVQGATTSVVKDQQGITKQDATFPGQLCRSFYLWQ